VSVPLEREVQRRVVALYRTVGCAVYSLSQGYRPGGPRHATTRQSKGLPDLYVFPPTGAPWWHETKRAGGKQSPEQVGFQVRCDVGVTDYILGGTKEALLQLVKRRLWKLPPEGGGA
jgi:hypothetical protein